MRGFLRSPKLIIGELGALAALCAIGAAVPQIGSATDAELAWLRDGGPVAALVRTFALDDIFHSVWFLVPVLFAAASLLVVVIEQFRRVRTMWSQRLTPAHFNSAPFRAEFERPVAPAGLPGEPAGGPARNETRIWSERRIGLTGSLVFHAGLLLIVAAGALRALFATDAVVDLLENETLAPAAAAWDRQVPGLLGRPLALDRAITLRAVNSSRYERGDLRELALRLDLGGEERELAINRELRVAGGRLFLGHDFGPAALIEWRQHGTSAVRERVLLADAGRGDFEEKSSGPAGLRAYVRAHIDTAGGRPAFLEVRVMRGSALIRAGEVRVGQTLALPGGASLTLHGLPFWARLRASNDPALGLAFGGFALLMLGATIMFSFVKVDACVVVTPAGDREKVFVALRPQRFAPIFADRFARLLREQGAPA